MAGVVLAQGRLLYPVGMEFQRGYLTSYGHKNTLIAFIDKSRIYKYRGFLETYTGICRQ